MGEGALGQARHVPMGQASLTRPVVTLPALPRQGSPDLSLLAVCGIAVAAALVGLMQDSAISIPLALPSLEAYTLPFSVSAALVCLLWPELALPVVIIGADLIDHEFGGVRVRHLVLTKLILLSFAGAGIIAATWWRRERFRRVKTPADAPALALVAYTGLSASYGYLVAGRDLDLVAVAGYHLSQLALYHFLVTITLGRPTSFRRAGLIIVAWSLIWTVPSLATPGRGGGAATTWVIVLLCYLTVGARTRWGPLLWAALPLVLLDTLTSGFRTLWVRVMGQLAWLAALGMVGRLPRLVLAALAVLVMGAAAGAAALCYTPLFSFIPAGDTLARFGSSFLEGGYRIPEALIGLEALRASPVLGHGVGYQVPLQWVQTMGYMPVGPIYHLYYVSYLTNEGIVGLAIILWYFGAALFSSPARQMLRRAPRDGWAAIGLGLQAALMGAILGALFAGPADGHWTWGMFGAASLLPAVWHSGRGGSVKRAGAADRWLSSRQRADGSHG